MDKSYSGARRAFVLKQYQKQRQRRSERRCSVEWPQNANLRLSPSGQIPRQTFESFHGEPYDDSFGREGELAPGSAVQSAMQRWRKPHFQQTFVDNVGCFDPFNTAAPFLDAWDIFMIRDSKLIHLYLRHPTNFHRLEKII